MGLMCAFMLPSEKGEVKRKVKKERKMILSSRLAGWVEKICFS